VEKKGPRKSSTFQYPGQKPLEAQDEKKEKTSRGSKHHEFGLNALGLFRKEKAKGGTFQGGEGKNKVGRQSNVRAKTSKPP